MNHEYKTAELSNETLQKLQQFEGEIRTVADKNVVLIAYENEKNHRSGER